MICDRYLVEYDVDYHDRVYSALADLLEAAQLDGSVVRGVLKNQSHEIEGLLCERKPLEELVAVSGNQFDFTLSNAVFEHVSNPAAAVASLFGSMASGALGSHQIDFRDHRDFNKPLEFLLDDEWPFQTPMYESGSFFGNRIRPFQFLAILKDAGFEILNVEETNQVSEDYFAAFLPRLRARQASSFWSMDSSQLKTLGVNLIIRKP